MEVSTSHLWAHKCWSDLVSEGGLVHLRHARRCSISLADIASCGRVTAANCLIQNLV